MVKVTVHPGAWQDLGGGFQLLLKGVQATKLEAHPYRDQLLVVRPGGWMWKGVVELGRVVTVYGSTDMTVRVRRNATLPL